MYDLACKAALIPSLSSEPVWHNDQNFHQLPYDEPAIRLKVNALVRDVYSLDFRLASGVCLGVVNADWYVQLEPSRNSPLACSHGFLLRL
jgi:hypothetical protein